MNSLPHVRLMTLLLLALAATSTCIMHGQEVQSPAAQQKLAAAQQTQVDAAGEPLQRLPPLKLPASVVEEKDIIFARYGNREMMLNLFRPETGNGPFPAVVFIHGGAWVMGDRGSFGHQASYLASKGYVCVSIDYRLSTEATYPAALYDSKAAVRWVRANVVKYKIDPNKIAAVGGSSGGYLVAMLGTTADVKAMEGDGGNAQFSSRVQAVVAFFPPTDLPSLAIETETHTAKASAAVDAVKGFLGGTLDQIPEIYMEASPVAHVSKTSAPFLFLHGDSDSTIPMRQSLEMQKALEGVGVRAEFYPVKNGKHGFINFLEYLELSNQQTEKFLNSVFNRK